MSEVIKISYRSFGGFLFFSFMFLFAASSFVFLVGGIIILGLSVFFLIDPSILEIIPVMFIDTRITDPMSAFIMGLIIGIFVVLLGLGFYVLTIRTWNYGLRLDRGLSKYVDSKLPQASHLLKRSNKVSDQRELPDKLSKLERLANLKEKGTITDSEFEQEKQLILKGKY